MNRTTQGLLLAFLGAVLLQLALSDAYLRYVTAWMKWPIVVSGVLLLALALAPVLRLNHTDHAHHVPAATWLLLLPGLVVFVVSPPQLGSYLAERRADDQQVVNEPAELATFDPSVIIPVDVTEFIWRAQEGGGTLEGQQVQMRGFVSYDDDDHWYLTRMAIGCCAADAIAYRVQVADDEVAPSRDQWVEVTGVYTPGTGTTRRSDPVIAASAVDEIDAPRQTYE